MYSSATRASSRSTQLQFTQRTRPWFAEFEPRSVTGRRCVSPSHSYSPPSPIRFGHGISTWPRPALHISSSPKPSSTSSKTRRPAPTSVTTARRAPCRSSNCSPLGRSDGKAIDDVAKDGGVGVDLGEPGAGAVGRLVREAAGAVDAVRDDVPVAVEDVVDDLEEQPELLAERTPRLLLRVGHGCDGEREADRGGEEPARLQGMERRLVRRGAGDVEVLPADHAERRIRELARHVRRVVRGREAEGLGEKRVAGEDAHRLAVLLPRRRAAAPLLVVVERRKIVVDERERVHELERERRRYRLLRLAARRLRRREADHRTHALAADRERVAHGLRLPVQLGPEAQRVEALLDEAPQLVRTCGHRPPPRASPARAPPRPTSRARTARRGSRARGRATRPRCPPRAGRARRAPPRAARAAPPPCS